MLTAALVVARALRASCSCGRTAPERILVVGDADGRSSSSASSPPTRRSTPAVVGRSPLEADADPSGDTRAGPARRRCRRCSSEHRIERVIVAPTHEGGDDVVDVIRLATACGVRVAVLPRLLEVIGSSVEFDDLGGQALLGVRGFGLSPSSRLLKRALDLVVAGAGARRARAVAAALIALAVRLSSPGPVLFRQTRIGRHGSEFQMLKFRTMVEGADELQARAAGAQRGRAAVQDRRRPAHDARRPLAAPLLARRGPPAPQRRARRHEHGRPAPAGRRGGPALLGLAAPPLPRRARDHRAVADPGLEPRAGQRHGHPRLPLLRELVAVARREDHGPHDALHLQPPSGEYTAKRR